MCCSEEGNANVLKEFAFVKCEGNAGKKVEQEKIYEMKWIL